MNTFTYLRSQLEDTPQYKALVKTSRSNGVEYPAQAMSDYLIEPAALYLREVCETKERKQRPMLAPIRFSLFPIDGQLSIEQAGMIKIKRGSKFGFLDEVSPTEKGLDIYTRLMDENAYEDLSPSTTY